MHLLISIIVQIIFVTKYFHFWAYKKKYSVALQPSLFVLVQVCQMGKNAAEE